MTIDRADAVVPFNSPLETGLRSLCILVAALPASFDMQELAAFDHLVVHTGDIEGAPSSLHPATNRRTGELLVRRKVVERGLLLMESKGLIKKLVDASGIKYRAEEFAAVFLESLSNTYMRQLYARAQWAAETYKDEGEALFTTVFSNTLDRWASEFQFEQLTVVGDQ